MRAKQLKGLSWNSVSTERAQSHDQVSLLHHKICSSWENCLHKTCAVFLIPTRKRLFVDESVKKPTQHHVHPQPSNVGEKNKLRFQTISPPIDARIFSKTSVTDTSHSNTQSSSCNQAFFLSCPVSPFHLHNIRTACAIYLLLYTRHTPFSILPLCTLPNPHCCYTLHKV